MSAAKTGQSKGASVIRPDKLDDEEVKTPGQIIDARESTGTPVKDKKPRGRRRIKPKQLFAIGILILLVVAVGWHYHQTSQKAKKEEVKAFQAMIALEATAINRGQDDIAKKLLTDFQAKYPKNKDKQQLYKIANELGAIYQRTGDFKTAKEWQTKALNNNSNLTFADYYNLATACQQAGDKPCAIKYYKLALERLEQSKDKPMTSQPYQKLIKTQLQALGG